MKKGRGFWQSLEIYTWKVVGRTPLPRYWPWVGVGLVLIVMIASLLNAKNSVAGARDMREVILRALDKGDYEQAQKLMHDLANARMNELVLGAGSELEDKVYPERVVERRILELETKLGEYPGNRQIYLMLGELYGQLDNQTKAAEYREKARVLDPNNLEFR